jgi:hypothetical protein
VSGAAQWRLAGGLVALLFLAVHATVHLRRRTPEHLLWACTLANALIAFGLLWPSPVSLAIGVLWLLFGLPLWIVGLAIGERFNPTATLTHVGGLAVGLLGTSSLGMPRGTWWKALLALALLQLLSRGLTPRAANVNLASRSGRSQLLLLLVAAAVFWCGEHVLELQP